MTQDEDKSQPIKIAPQALLLIDLLIYLLALIFVFAAVMFFTVDKADDAVLRGWVFVCFAILISLPFIFKKREYIFAAIAAQVAVVIWLTSKSKDALMEGWIAMGVAIGITFLIPLVKTEIKKEAERKKKRSRE